MQHPRALETAMLARGVSAQGRAGSPRAAPHQTLHLEEASQDGRGVRRKRKMLIVPAVPASLPRGVGEGSEAL